MNQTGASAVVGVFSDRIQAGRAVQKLTEAGFQDRQIRVTSSHECPDDFGESTVGTHADSGALWGSVIGAALGGVMGVGLVAGILPALGVRPVSGTIATLLLCVAVGSAGFGLAGLLIGYCIRKQAGNHYADRLERGGLVIEVQANGQSAVALEILDSYGGIKH